MSDSFSPGTAPIIDTPADNQFIKPWVIVLRIIWVILTILSISIYALLLPGRFEQLQEATLVGLSSIQQLGLTPTFYAWYHIVLEGTFVLIYSGIGIFIFLQKADNWVAIFTSLALISFGVATDFPIDAPSVVSVEWPWLVSFVRAVGLASSLVIIYILPDGRFIPRWTGVLAAIWGAWAITWVLFPNSPINFIRWYETPLMTVPLYATTSLWYGSGVAAQLLRYFRVSTPVQRQQTKWLVYGLTILIVSYIILNSPYTIFPVLQTPGLPRLIFGLVHKPLMILALLVMPLCISVAVRRYRLWNIDFVINRSLVYGGLTGFLFIVFMGSTFGIQRGIQAISGEKKTPTFALITSTVIAAGLFQPTRTALRRFVDRKLYGIEVDYRKVAQPHDLDRTPTMRTEFGGYTELEFLGRGGMGEVFRGHHPMLNRNVAIKILPHTLASTEHFRRRFIREARTIARLRHRNIIQLHDFGEIDGIYYMVMEYIEGHNLRDYLYDHGRFTVEETLPFLHDIADALDYAHRRDIVHRDIKPSNIMIEPTASTDDREPHRTHRAILMDFGIVHIVGGDTPLTGAGLIGTFNYIAPEQIQASTAVDGRADVYSLGVMAYQVLTGELPFKHNNPGAILLAHLQQPPPDPRGLVSDLPEHVAVAIMSAMAKDPDARYSTAGEFAAAFESA